MAGGINAIANLLGKVDENGALLVTLSGGTATATQFLAGDGTAAAPSYTFSSSGNGDNGMFLSAANVLGWSAAGTERLTLSASALTSTVPIVGPSGSTSATSFGFGNGNTGLYSPTGGDAAIAANGNAVFGVANSTTAIRLAANYVLGFTDTTNSVVGASAIDVALSRGAANNLALASGDSFSLGGAQAAATTATKLVKKVTGIADNTATDVLTVTIPNANHAASIRLTLLSSNGSTDAFESSRTAEGAVVVARTTGANAVAVTATLELAQIATVAGGATHTLAYGVSAISGAVGATNTFTIQVTIDDSGNLGSNQVVVLAEVLNAEATGITIA